MRVSARWAGLAALLLGFASGVWVLLPGRAHVSRSAVIAAPPATVFELLDDAAAVRRWSPWRAPGVRFLFSGPPVGLGARMDWSGGSVRIEAAQPYGRVGYGLTIDGRPGTADFRIEPAHGGTRVSWRLARTAGWNPIDRFRLLLFRAQTGPELERGLERLGDMAEALPRADLAAARVRLVEGPSGASVAASAGAADPASTTAALRLFMGIHRLAATAPPRVQAAMSAGEATIMQPVRQAGR